MKLQKTLSTARVKTGFVPQSEMYAAGILLIMFALQLPVVLHAETSDSPVADSPSAHNVMIQRWQQLAQQGNPIAQYNLALAYKTGRGIAEDQQQASRWMKQAARSRLVAAYNQFDNNAIRPGKPVNVVYQPSGIEQFLSQQGARYTIQLISSPNQQRIEKFFYENGLQGKASHFSYQKDGREWHAIVYGTYASLNDANGAIATMEENLRQWNPWVRNISAVRALLQ